MGMVRHIVTVYHYYQDPHNPRLQVIELSCDYATAYAFFNSLISSGKDFDVILGTREGEQKGKVE